PVAAIVAILLVLGNLGGVGAWLAGSARLPYVAGVDGALPAAFGRIHPQLQTPYVGLLLQAAIATVFWIASLVGTTVKNAYLVLTQTTLILFFIPYLYLFLAYLRLRRQRTVTTALAGLVGSAAVLFSIVLGFVTPADETHPWLYKAKVVGGVVGFMLLGVLLGGRREIPGFDFRKDGVWRRQARAVRALRARLLSRRSFGALNAPMAAVGAPLASATAVSGVLRVPAVLMKFKDTPATQLRTASQYDQVLFAASPTGASAGRPYTYRSFYEQMSNGLLCVQGQSYGYAA